MYITSTPSGISEYGERLSATSWGVGGSV